MDRILVSTSKFLSLILRHQPEAIRLTLDEHGWADIESLILAARENGRDLDYDLLIRVVHENDKQRFAISDDGLRIRANQGHSIAVTLGLQPRVPPDELYHGTVERFLASIRQQGLIRDARQHVHLSADTRTAEIVGKRRGPPIVLVVETSRMHGDDFAFFRSHNGVWLTDHVPVAYIRFPQR